MDLVKIYMQLKSLAESEWKDMHHNASISGSYPDFESEALSSEFHEWWLGDHTSMLIEFLHDIIKERFGYDLKFYSYGRSGATIAPDEWMNARGGNGFGGWNEKNWDDTDPTDEESIEDQKAQYREVIKNNISIIKCMRYINTYWKAEAEYIPKAWKEYCKDKYGDVEDYMKFYSSRNKMDDSKKDEKGFDEASLALSLYKSINIIDGISVNNISPQSKSKLARAKNYFMKIIESEKLTNYYEALQA